MKIFVKLIVILGRILVVLGIAAILPDLKAMLKSRVPDKKAFLRASL